MQPDESFQDYMQGFAAGLKSGDGRPPDPRSPRAWLVGFEAGRAVRRKAERSASLGYFGMQSISLNRRDLLA